MIVYHRTSEESGRRILAEKRFTSRELGEVCVSDARDGYAKDYGPFVVTLDVPEDLLTQDDEFQTGEMHYRIAARDIRPRHIVRGEMDGNEQQS